MVVVVVVVVRRRLDFPFRFDEETYTIVLDEKHVHSRRQSNTIDVSIVTVRPSIGR
jgi:hypothetical protein